MPASGVAPGAAAAGAAVRRPACRPGPCLSSAAAAAPRRGHGSSSSSSGAALCHVCSQQQRTAASQQRQAVACGSSSDGGAAADGRMPEEDQSIRVKCMLAESSGRLDLSECELAAVPPAAFNLPELEELSIAGNWLTELPPQISQLTGLARLQLAGNQLRSLPPGISHLGSLAGLWLHGNLLQSLPPELGRLSSLTQLSLSGNCLEELPASLSSLAGLQELSAAGNRLAALPAGIGALSSLTKLHLHGNQLRELPSGVSGLLRLQELSLQGNPALAILPDALGALPALRELSAADCGLAAVPASLGSAPALETLSLYGNQLRSLPPGLLQAPKLKTLWMESNPLTPEAVAALLEGLPASSVSALGLDEGQLDQLPLAQRERLVTAAGPKLRVSRIVPPPGGSGGAPGYFKLDLAPPAAAAAGNGSSRPSTEVLVVSFGSAPGTPNWGGLLKKVRAAAATPQEQNFDVLYVVDPHRSWYCGGDEGYEQYERRLRAACARYRHVVFIGDSMGATAALLFSHLATEVHAWTPQIDLATSSIRPGEGGEWQVALRRRVLDNVAACRGSITVHTGSWRHDLDQAKCLPSQPGLKVQIYSFESHRLALALDRRGALVQIVRSAVLQAMGLSNKDGIRLANLY